MSCHPTDNVLRYSHTTMKGTTTMTRPAWVVLRHNAVTPQLPIRGFDDVDEAGKYARDNEPTFGAWTVRAGHDPLIDWTCGAEGLLPGQLLDRYAAAVADVTKAEAAIASATYSFGPGHAWVRDWEERLVKARAEVDAVRAHLVARLEDGTPPF